MPGICEVDVVQVDFEPKHASPGHQPDGDTPFEIANKNSRKLFAVAGQLNGSGDWNDVDKQHAQALCQQVKIEPDMYSRNAADNVFSADSPSLAESGASVLNVVITAAADKGPLGFKISCDGAAQFCANPRDELAKLSIHRFESVVVVDCNVVDEACYHVTGGGYRADWSADIVVAHQAGDIRRDHITSVRFSETLNPLE